MSESPQDKSYASDDYVVDFDGTGLGPEIEVSCPECHKAIGTIRRDEGGDLLCTSCATLFRAKVVDDRIEMHRLRRVVITDDDGRMTPGQVLNRPDLVEGPTMKQRIIMVGWAALLTALMMAALWLIQFYLLN